MLSLFVIPAFGANASDAETSDAKSAMDVFHILYL